MVSIHRLAIGLVRDEGIGAIAGRGHKLTILGVLQQRRLIRGRLRDMQIFDVRTGKSIKHMRFVYKLKQVEFDYGSNRVLLLHD